MKRKSLFVVVLLALGSFSACEKDVNDVITMKVEPEIVTKDTPINLVIENHTNKKLGMACSISMEYFDNGNWIYVDIDIPYYYMLCCLLPKEKREGSSYISDFGLEKLGRYRIAKVFYYNKKEYKVYAEFEIK